ncbi:MAG TPA: aspartate aminotransferase family protein [Bacillota bacterium]|nr:aspartate aminotransferase family protein [Bacillota bacterium]HOB87020.1 aspartate aminotransferase family protein [Bacillota bacterium]HOP68348.1 aspartate aminotransferase family protein [Bacillota bacterium]HPT33483.1 aspartate aminotransferase family protein [Bacillota bacterium]HPZ63978.1 aspartate aminotransferase family protein [Bacillota bacterium]
MSNREPITLPEKGLGPEKVLELLKHFKKGDVDYKESRTWSLVYYLGEEHTRFLLEAMGMFLSENGLNPMAFQSLKRMEHEIVQMTAGMLHGDRNVVGMLTSGGTESCLLPVLAYRNLAESKKRLKPVQPEMIVPESIHVAWEKAAHYFKVKMVRAPLRSDFRVDVEAVKKLINRNTALIVASAPSYPHGVIDPIEELGRLAEEHHLPFHVDSCLGGFFLPFMEKLGYQVPPFDFRVPGVTSISADVHKYGYSAKGASVLLYRNMDYMKHQIFVSESWPGGVFASPGLLGTRPGGAFAAAWATMMAMGWDGYLEQTKIVMETARALMEGIASIPGLELMGQPDMSVFGYRSTSPRLSIFAVGDQMEERGWHIDRLQKPDGLHAMVTPLHRRIVDRYLEDLRESVEYVRENPSLALKGSAATYGMISKVPLRGVVKNEVRKMMEKMYGPDMEMPF